MTFEQFKNKTIILLYDYHFGESEDEWDDDFDDDEELDEESTYDPFCGCGGFFINEPNLIEKEELLKVIHNNKN